MNIHSIRTSWDFIKFMESIWMMESKPAPGGGVILYGHPDYDRYHNAIETARRCGMTRTGGSVIDGKLAHVYRLPNGDGVRIAADGSAVVRASRFGHKPKNRARRHPQS